MIDGTRTTTVLLEGLFDSDNEAAWSEFDARYRPILIGFARRLGLADGDANDVAQETLLHFVTAYRKGQYDRDRGRLRSWLIGIAKNRAARAFRKAGREAAPAGSAVLALPDEHALTEVWDAERRRVLLREALDELRLKTRIGETTIRAFELLVVRQMPVRAIARELEISEHDVYLAKSRVAARLREIVGRLETALDEAAP